jgi:hypothetical protein
MKAKSTATMAPAQRDVARLAGQERFCRILKLVLARGTIALGRTRRNGFLEVHNSMIGASIVSGATTSNMWFWPSLP